VPKDDGEEEEETCGWPPNQNAHIRPFELQRKEKRKRGEREEGKGKRLGK